MKTFLVTLHSLFTILAIILLTELLKPENLSNLLLVILFLYTFIILTFSVFLDSIQLSFPRNIGIWAVFGFYLFQLFTKKYFVGDHSQVVQFLSMASLLVIIYFLIQTILFSKSGLKLKKFKTTIYRNYYFISYLITIIALVSIGVIYLQYKTTPAAFWNYSISILIAIFPFFNRKFVMGFACISEKLSSASGISFDFNQFGIFGKLKNFVFAKDKYISTGKYQIIDSDYRSSIMVITVMQLANQLSGEWDKKYQKLFSLEDYQLGHIKYSIVEKNENGISVIDDNAIMYHFGNNAFLKGKIKREEGYNIFLAKNDQLIGKFKVNEKIADEKVELVNQLDYFGNTILFVPGQKEDLGRDYSIVFDRIYSEINEKRQLELLKDLERKEPTGMICGTNPGKTGNSINFFINSSIDAAKNEKIISATSDNVLFVPELINASKKMHTFLKYALFSSILIQAIILLLSLLFVQNKLVILGILLISSLGIEFFAKFFKRKLSYLPDQPAILAQSHQAA